MDFAATFGIPKFVLDKMIEKLHLRHADLPADRREAALAYLVKLAKTAPQVGIVECTAGGKRVFALVAVEDVATVQAAPGELTTVRGELTGSVQV